MAKPITTPDNYREKELFRAILSTPHGKELKEIWMRKLTMTKNFQPEQSEQHCRYVGGRHSVYIDAIKAHEELKNVDEQSGNAK